MVLSRRIISALFQGGQFNVYSVDLTSGALFFYSIGLFAYGSTRILQSCFFALKDTLTPAKVSFLALILNIILNSLLMFPMKIAGLALATSISGIISFCVLFSLLRKRLKPFTTGDIISSFLRILLASVGMALVSSYVCSNFILSAGKLAKFLNLGFAIAAGFTVYILLCFIFRVREMQQLWHWLLQHRLR
jgi:putative peptidoglycan lipid II flippase